MKSLIVSALLLTPALARAGTYEVPVKVDLGGVNVLTLDVTYTTTPQGLETISYELPAELTGEPRISIALQLESSENGVMKMVDRNPGNVATCTLAAGEVHCDTSYDLTIIHFDLAQAYLTSQATDAPDLAKRLAVARAFAHEPIGILRFSLASP